ncbi:MBL fold metallo-hydrolase [Nonomuraea rhodomycinica]|uniref:MBL fold metallo-hydrolase n=1 Tax=Nonomuraea rhodomycinica TaxID=1712872 RepID=A0A7Y6INS5_9ACTN|nr:MBL fold metallo-hydrolase [Nonomuraea rhodomycinica]NUW41275.1 MBL fold metallo-hydrolase [Nonomuraea rhodomycinica]
MSVFRIPEREIAERPGGYSGPNLSPAGLRLTPHALADGVHALMASLPPKDNNGLVAGRDAALVVDAGITPDVSRQIQDLAAELTDRPLRYLVNTTYHGDHTFGNLAFPAETVIVSSRANRDNMTDLGYEKQVRGGNMYGDDALLDAVTEWRLPDLVFDSRAEIDLGGRTVVLWHFGPGNGPGDTVVHVPDAEVAWTGNLLAHAGIAHMLLQGGPRPYAATLRAMKEALPGLRTIVPGHGPMGPAHPAIDALLAYLERLDEDVSAAVAAGRTLEETMAACADPWAGDRLDPALEAALAGYGLPTEAVTGGMLALCRDLHRLNVLATYRLYHA